MLGDVTEQRRRAILAEIDSLGLVLPGCIIERTTRCQTPGCRCRADPPQPHGPYRTWTHRERGRQIARTISVEDAAKLRPLIDANRRLHQLVRELEEISIGAVQQLLG